MPKSARPEAPRALAAGAALIAAITLARIVLLWHSDTDLFVDEAQYWQWGQQLEAGYYSKPPLIGWVIRAFTELAGSDAPFWIRLPGPLFHAATAMVVMLAARPLAGGWAAAMTGIAYLTMPAVAVGSLLISTDTILMPFFALAVLLYLRLACAPSAGVALAMGAALGAGMMAKYAAIYFVLGATLGALFVPRARIRWRDAALAALAFLVVFSPNIAWNIQNGLTTLAHTADNIDWVNDPSARMRLNITGMLEFLGGQFGVMGPVFFGAYLAILWQGLRGRVTDWTQRWLIWISLPVIGLVTVQALLSKAYANWAATAYVGAVLLTAPWLWQRARRVFWAALIVNAALSAALPIAATQATSWTIGDRLVLSRYTGRAALSARILAEARAAGTTDIISGNREVLADLFHAGKGTELRIHSIPFEGRPPHYYAQRHPYPGGDAPALLVLFADNRPPCEAAERTAAWIAGPGAYAGHRLTTWRIPPDCFRRD